MSINPKSWAEAFTAELTVDGEQIPLDRMIARHTEALKGIRGWIAGLLVRAGAWRADGKLISADQIRVSLARCVRDTHEKGCVIRLNGNERFVTSR